MTLLGGCEVYQLLLVAAAPSKPLLSSLVISDIACGAHYLGNQKAVMEELYSTLLPYGQVHCMSWSGANLVAVSLSEELPDHITEGNKRCNAAEYV